MNTVPLSDSSQRRDAISIAERAIEDLFHRNDGRVASS